MARARVSHTLAWLRALCGLARGGLFHTIFLRESDWRQGRTIIVDASPWGGGAFLSEDGAPAAWWSTAWGADDVHELGLVIGDHRFQGLVESYAVLIAIKCWSDRWAAEPTSVVVKSDSMSAIGGLEKGGTTRSIAVNRVLSEMAIVLAGSPTGLRVTMRHLPGATNEWADALSRIAQPGSGARIPAPLLACDRTDVEGRGGEWWHINRDPAEVLKEGRARAPEAAPR